MEYKVSVNAYEMNQVTLYAVQGEADSRTIIFSIIEKSGIQIPTSNAIVVDKMLDLTDYTAKLYVIRPDNSIASCDGTITDAENGIVTFILSTECTEFAGNAECAVVFTKGNTNLRVVGISLYIAICDIDGSNSNSDNTIAAYTINYTADNVESLVKNYATVDTDEEATTE